ncbi:MAG: DUF5317 family protein [Roseiflexaceae bacterium]
MLGILIILTVIALALLRGGSLHNLAAVRLRWLPLVFASLALQLLIFTPFRTAPLVGVATPWLYLLSMLMLAAWVAANWHIPGMALMAAGLLLNLAAITANGGYMPIAPEATHSYGISANYTDDGRHNNSVALVAGQAYLWLLTDIIVVPFAGVFSIGDVLLMLGVAICCYRTIQPAPALAPAST